jgi:hypothetical protein
MKRLLIALLILPAAALSLGLVLVGVFVLQFFPPVVSWAAAGMLLVMLAWFFFGRRGASIKIAGSETSLMGRQSSKEGLL